MSVVEAKPRPTATTRVLVPLESAKINPAAFQNAPQGKWKITMLPCEKYQSWMKLSTKIFRSSRWSSGVSALSTWHPAAPELSDRRDRIACGHQGDFVRPQQHRRFTKNIAGNSPNDFGGLCSVLPTFCLVLSHLLFFHIQSDKLSIQHLEIRRDSTFFLVTKIFTENFRKFLFF